MNLKITFKSGKEAINYREFCLEAHHVNPAPDTVAPLLIHLTDMLTNLHPGDLMEVIPSHVPDLAEGTVTKSEQYPKQHDPEGEQR